MIIIKNSWEAKRVKGRTRSATREANRMMRRKRMPLIKLKRRRIWGQISCHRNSSRTTASDKRCKTLFLVSYSSFHDHHKKDAEQGKKLRHSLTIYWYILSWDTFFSIFTTHLMRRCTHSATINNYLLLVLYVMLSCCYCIAFDMKKEEELQ